MAFAPPPFVRKLIMFMGAEKTAEEGGEKQAGTAERRISIERGM